MNWLDLNKKFFTILQKTGLIILAILRLLGKRIKIKAIRFWRFWGYLNWQTFRELMKRSGELRFPGLSAEIAYNSILALFPGIIAIISAFALFNALRRIVLQITDLLKQIVPEEVTYLLSGVINEIVGTRNLEIFSFSFIGSLWLFSGVLNSVMIALDLIHQTPRPARRKFIKAKLVALCLAIGTLLLLILASSLVLVSDFAIEILIRKSCVLEVIPNCPIDEILLCLFKEPVSSCAIQTQLQQTWQKLMWPISLGIVAIAFAFIYRYGPSQRERYTPILPGAILAAMIWAIASNLFRIYVLHFGDYNRTYGTIGTFIVLLLWLYLSAFAVLIGAQLNVIVGEKMSWQKLPKLSAKSTTT